MALLVFAFCFQYERQLGLAKRWERKVFCPSQHCKSIPSAHQTISSRIKQVLVYQIEFWGELLKKTHNLQVLQKHGANIVRAIMNSQRAYTQLLKLNSNSANVCRLYGSFLVNVSLHVLSQGTSTTMRDPSNR